jgi:hypothetical protein
MNMKKAVIAIIVLVIIVVGYRYYSIYSVKKVLIPIIHNITLRISNNLKMEYEDSQITYKEYFEKAEKDLAEIDSKIIDIQTVNASFGKSEVEAALNYAKASQELLRSTSNAKRKQLAFESGIKWAKKSFEDAKEAGEFGREYAYKHANKAYKDVDNASVEYIEAMNVLLKSIKKMEDARKLTRNSFSEKYLIEPIILSKATKDIQKVIEVFKK